MRLLLSNDDGIYSEGLLDLYKVLVSKHTVNVVAPDRECSASSHKITLNRPLFAEKVKIDTMIGYKINGFPADCVKLGLSKLFKDNIDVVISGINTGSNNGVSIHYSGTVAAARESRLMGVPGIAISLYSAQDKNFIDAGKFLLKFLEKYEKIITSEISFLNINIPPFVDYKKAPIFCKMGLGSFMDEYRVVNHLSKDYYWTGGGYKIIGDKDSDDYQIKENQRITITPLSIDSTDYNTLEKLRS